ncbi:MAG TPA: hypothetical protein VGL40_11630, partial [Bacillota bacterium]
MSSEEVRSPWGKLLFARCPFPPRGSRVLRWFERSGRGRTAAVDDGTMRRALSLLAEEEGLFVHMESSSWPLATGLRT